MQTLKPSFPTLCILHAILRSSTRSASRQPVFTRWYTPPTISRRSMAKTNLTDDASNPNAYPSPPPSPPLHSALPKQNPSTPSAHKQNNKTPYSSPKAFTERPNPYPPSEAHTGTGDPMLSSLCPGMESQTSGWIASRRGVSSSKAPRANSTAHSTDTGRGAFRRRVSPRSFVRFAVLGMPV